MSIKSGQEKLKMKPLLFVLLALTLIFGGVRLFQLKSQIDAETGFFTGNLAFNRAVLYAVPILGVLWLIVSFLSKDAGGRTVQGLSGRALAVVTALMACGMAFDVVKAGVQIQSIKQIADAQTNGLFATGEFALIGEALFGALGAVYLILLAVGYFKGGLPEMTQTTGARLLALTPMLWAASRMMHHFLIKINFSRVSDLFLELLMLGFMTLFFLYFAQVHSNVYRVGYEWRLFGFGIPAALVAGMLSLSRLAAMVVCRGAVREDYPFRPADCAFFLFAFLLCFALLKQPQEALEPFEDDADDDE